MLSKVHLPSRLALIAMACIGIACNQPAVKQEKAAPPPVIPISQETAINLSFVGLKDQPSNLEDFMGRFDQDEFKHFPLRYPVNNFAMYTKVQPADEMHFAFMSIWGEYKADLYGLKSKPGDGGHVNIPVRDYSFKIAPKLLAADKGMYNITILNKDGAKVATLALKGKGDDAELKAASKQYVVKRVFRDTMLRISGFEIRRAGAKVDERPILGIQLIAEGWGDSRLQRGILPGWSKYKRVFPEVDMRVLPQDWFYGKDIPSSCMRLKATAFDQVGKRVGYPMGDPRADTGGWSGGGGGGGRCYG